MNNEQVRAAALEEAAKLCDWLNGEKRLIPAGCAAAIRALVTSAATERSGHPDDSGWPQHAIDELHAVLAKYPPERSGKLADDFEAAVRKLAPDVEGALFGGEKRAFEYGYYKVRDEIIAMMSDFFPDAPEAASSSAAPSELRAWLSTLEDVAHQYTGAQLFTKVRTYLTGNGYLAAPAPSFDASKACSPMLTECPRCKNAIGKCDDVFSAPAPLVSAAPSEYDSASWEKVVSAIENDAAPAPTGESLSAIRTWEDRNNCGDSIEDAMRNEVADLRAALAALATTRQTEDGGLSAAFQGGVPEAVSIGSITTGDVEYATEGAELSCWDVEWYHKVIDALPEFAQPNTIYELYFRAAPTGASK